MYHNEIKKNENWNMIDTSTEIVHIQLRLKIVRLPQHILPLYTNVLARLILFPCHGFINYTVEANGDLSLILDEGSMEHLYKQQELALEHHHHLPIDDDNELNSNIVYRGGSAYQHIENSGITWSLLQICAGATGGDQTGVISRVSTALADRGISIFFLSCYDADYLLVPIQKLGNALAVLAQLFPCSNAESSDVITGDRAYNYARSFCNDNEWRQVDNDNRIKALKNPQVDSDVSTDGHLSQHRFSLYSSRVVVATVENIHKSSAALMWLLFFPHVNNDNRADNISDLKLERFFSLTVYSKRVSMIVEVDELQRADFPPGQVLLERDVYKLVRVDDGVPLGFTETGIMAKQTRTFHDASISIFYLSTFFTDYTLIHEHDLERVRSLLHISK